MTQPKAFPGFAIEDAPVITAREDEGIAVPILDPRTSTVVAEITVVGTYSRTYRQAQDAVTERAMRERRTTRPTTEEIDENVVGVVARCIRSWTGFTKAGVPYDHTEANAVALLRQAPFILEQLQVAMKDHERFFATSSSA